MALPSLLLFGSQTTWPSPEQFTHLRTSLLREPLLRTFVKTIRDLPDFWNVLVESDPALQNVTGLETLKLLRHWLDHGNHFCTAWPPPNTLYTPLTVIIHLVHYFHYLTSTKCSVTHADLLRELQIGGIQGFCTGFLSAVAVACSNSEEDVCIFGGVVLRLAVCIGAYVDLDSRSGSSQSETVCLAVRWKSDTGKEKLTGVLSRHQRAYISVIVDDNNVTVTIPKSAEASITGDLAAAGLLVKAIELQGRFHSPALEDSLRKVVQLCRAIRCLQLPPAGKLLVPVRNNFDGAFISEGQLSEIAAATLLANIADWRRTVLATMTALLKVKDAQVVVFGLPEVISTSSAREAGLDVLKIDLSKSMSTGEEEKPRYPANAIAIVGMACKYAGADTTDELWEVIRDGLAMHEQLPETRWSTGDLRRTKKGAPFWGNFVRDVDAFDHRFFKKSSREAAAMDPQQRMLLQAAYQAVESSGYLGELSPPDDVGCYVGVATTDYHDNISSETPTAFSALGELRAFLCGRISYHFGWTGPSMTYDTACSSSTVAIDAACKAIQSGQCSRALAGGVSANTSPYMWENLRSANFLSPTGPTKPFDANADGYCRGEGVGLVFLKKLSTALDDGDAVLGVISASGVNQCKNETYITVPHGPSQVNLYEKVMDQAGLQPNDVSFVEAHGTGTQAGDPVEVASIRKVFGGSLRTQKLHLGSTKGNVGHCEAASGVASVIKTVLMLQNRMIPPVACHRSLNPKIPPLQPDKLAIPTACKPWETEFCAALVNNYGAAGNNSALIVCQPPPDLNSREEKVLLPKFPVFISAFSETSLIAWCKSLRKKVARLSAESSGGNLLADLAYSLSAKQNRSLPYMLATTAATLQELDEKLASASPSSRSAAKPVVLIFGGQTNNHVGLSDCVYNNSTLFRYHLDCCNAAIQKAGLQGIIPGIFQTEPVEDIVSLHCMFFAIQYACARSWMDSGLKISTVVGHSFGQMTAMCISGCISLEDAVSLVSGRASLIRKLWGSETGAMISLEADTETTLDIALKLSTPDSSLRAEIACYNGPQSHVLVGSAASIDRVEEMIASERPKIRYRRLRVTNGFHSEFTEPILSGLSEVAAKITFSKPSIPLESCSTTSNWTDVSPERIVEHTRSPVYFQEAIERIAGRLGACTWLEAGAGSSVTGMVRQALGPSSNMGHTYHAIHLNGSEAMGLLADATVNLWNVGNSVQFWPFHRKERYRFELKSLPPYIFDKSRHWLMWKDNIQSSPNTRALAPTPEHGEQKLLQFAKNQSHDQITTEFNVNPKSEEYKMCVKGHAVLGLALCPADLYVEIVSKAAIMLLPEAEESAGHIPCTEDLSIIAPLGIDADRAITLSMTRFGDTERAWTFDFSSSDQLTSEPWTKHATGRIRLSLVDDKELDSEFARLQHLVGPKRPISLCKDPEAEGIQGSMVYRTFNEVVNYAEYYQGIKSVFCKGDEVAAQISMPVRDDWMIENMHGDPIAVDNFVQVAGIKVNCLNHSPADQVFICGHIERIQPSKAFLHRDRKSRSWSVYAHSKGLGGKDYHNDIYVFDDNKQLAMLILGVRFTRVAIASLTKVLSTASAPQTPQATLKTGTGHSNISSPIKTGKAMAVAPKTSTKPASAKTNVQAVMSLGEDSDVKSILLNLLHSVADVPLDSIKDDSTFDELGVDSLTNTELLSEVCQAFDIEIPLREFGNLQTVNALRDYLVRQSALEQSSSSSATSPPPLSSSESLSENLSSAATSLSGQPELLKDNKRAKLAKLVVEHLETTVLLLTETCLGDLGLDSLLSVEIERDVEKAFGVELQPGSLTGETTFGQLLNMLSPQTSAPLVQDSQATDSVNEATIPLQSTSIPTVLHNVGQDMKTVLFKEAGATPLYADIYLPKLSQITKVKRPIALMIHGGGHTLLSRKDIRPKQTRLLLQKGLLPVSIDYRLCPEVNITDGPMTDVCDALKWARDDLPHLKLGISGLQADGDKVVVVGWSTGGTLSLTLGFTAVQRGIRPPEAILAFYCPTDYEADFWRQPNYPENSQNSVPESYDLLEGVQDTPITGYNVDPKKCAAGGWVALSDPRSRIVLHMNWTGQALPVLLNGLPNKNAIGNANPKQWLQLPQPPEEKVAAISPYAQIKRGKYKTPTYLIHGTKDDLIPWQQMQRTYDALVAEGVPAGLEIVEDAVHLFDLYHDRDGRHWQTVLKGYEFLFRSLLGGDAVQ